jgi:hypothetical protein
MVVRPSAMLVEWRGVSVKIARRPPTFGNARSSRRHRHLGRPAGDKRGKDHTNRSSDPIADAAREHEPGGPPDALGSGRDAGVGRIEAETVRALDRDRFLAHPTGQIQEFPDANVSSEAASQAPPGLRGQRRGYEEASPLEVEGRIHAQDVLARTWLVAHSPAHHSNDTVCTSLHTGKRRT